MPTTPDLQALEVRREELRQQLASLGDLRPGSLVGRYRKCGKPNCHCAEDGSQGHGPSWSLTRAACETPGAGGLAQSSILLVNTHSPWIADWMPALEDRRHAERWK